MDTLFIPIGFIERQRALDADTVLRLLLYFSLDLLDGTADGLNKVFTSMQGQRLRMDASIHRRLRPVPLPPDLHLYAADTVLQGYRIEAACELEQSHMEIARLDLIFIPEAGKLVRKYHRHIYLFDDLQVLGVSSIAEPDTVAKTLERLACIEPDPTIRSSN